MIRKLNEYMEYRKNRKAAIRALMKLAAALLPALEELTALLSDGKRILEILTYMAELTPEDIRKILIHSAVETMPDSPGSDTRQQKGR
jgi:hypothetical protein